MDDRPPGRPAGCAARRMWCRRSSSGFQPGSVLGFAFFQQAQQFIHLLQHLLVKLAVQVDQVGGQQDAVRMVVQKIACLFMIWYLSHARNLTSLIFGLLPLFQPYSYAVRTGFPPNSKQTCLISRFIFPELAVVAVFAVSEYLDLITVIFYLPTFFTSPIVLLPTHPEISRCMVSSFLQS